MIDDKLHRQPASHVLLSLTWGLVISENAHPLACSRHISTTKKRQTITTYTSCVCHSCSELPLSEYSWILCAGNIHYLIHTKYFCKLPVMNHKTWTPLCDFCAELLWTVSSSVPPWLHVHPVLTFTVCLVVKDSWWSAFELRKKSSYLNFVVIIWG